MAAEIDYWIKKLKDLQIWWWPLEGKAVTIQRKSEDFEVGAVSDRGPKTSEQMWVEWRVTGWMSLFLYPTVSKLYYSYSLK